MTKIVKTEIETLIDVKLTKEDIFNVLLSDKEEELKNEIEKIESKIGKENENLLDLENNLKEKVYKILNLTKLAEFSYGITNSILRMDYNNSLSISLYDIKGLSKLKNPSLSKNNKYNDTFNFYKFSEKEEFEVMLKVNRKDGFKGTLYKSIKFTPNKECFLLLEEYNKIIKYKSKLKIEKNNLEYKLITLDSNKKIKSEFIKKFMKKSDINKLLN